MTAINLSAEIEKQLPAALVDFLRAAGEAATAQGNHIYLVGGVVRDLLLGQPNLDLDLLVEGNAIELAQRLADNIKGKLTIHQRFGTARLQWDKWSADFACARLETYPRPGALPRIRPGNLNSDLIRRDFTINAMAVYLNPPNYGEFIDLYKGREDLEERFITILHERSFVDDATRIWRALRYEQRLDFNLEQSTLYLLHRDISMLDTISGDRIRHELLLVLMERFPEKVLSRASELEVLAKLHPSLPGDGWLAKKFAQARNISYPYPPPVALYLALFTYHLTGEEVEQLISYLRLPRALAMALRDTGSIQSIIEPLSNPGLAPSGVYRLLCSYSPPAITANLLACESPVARQNIRLFINRLRCVKTATTGNDLLKAGIPQGPRIKEILGLLHEARLDGKVTSKQGEERMVAEWLRENQFN